MTETKKTNKVEANRREERIGEICEDRCEPGIRVWNAIYQRVPHGWSSSLPTMAGDKSGRVNLY